MSNTDPAAGGRFAIIELHEHEPPPDRAIAHGAGPLVQEFLDASRIRADALDAMIGVSDAKLELADREEDVRMARIDALRIVAANITQRLDAFAARRDARREARAKAAAAAEAAATQAKVDRWPDPDAPDEPTHHPGGELHALAPTAAAGEPDPDEPDIEPDEGDLPRRISRQVPAAGGSLLPKNALGGDPRPPYPQPISVSLNSDEGDPTLAGETPPSRVGY
jgi:hypothetical protein